MGRCKKSEATLCMERIQRISKALDNYLEKNFDTCQFTVTVFEGIEGNDIVNNFFKNNPAYSIIWYSIDIEHLPNDSWNEHTTIRYAKTPERIDIMNFQKYTGIYID